MFARRYINGVIALGILALAGCGGSNTSVRVRTQGITRQTETQSAFCLVAGAPDATYSGVATEMDCGIAFLTDNIFADSITFRIYDVFGIYRDYLGKSVYIGNGLVDATVMLGNAPQNAIAGYVVFREITNVPGGRVSASYYIETAAGVVDGTLEAEVSVGLL